MVGGGWGVGHRSKQDVQRWGRGEEPMQPPVPGVMPLLGAPPCTLGPSNHHGRGRKEVQGGPLQPKANMASSFL